MVWPYKTTKLFNCVTPGSDIFFEKRLLHYHYLLSWRADASDGSSIFKGQVSGQGNICWGYGFFSPKQEATDAASALYLTISIEIFCLKIQYKDCRSDTLVCLVGHVKLNEHSCVCSSLHHSIRNY